ncbi:pentapeptide repeat protein [Parafrankia sp. EAN1pec]|uniref:pentapeptide repeat-containing protein n=1 Tax=Parafrankia sp. (strain EAN1pec) TaxID=298653 RepID=UPI0000543BD7|nr:pentapeptide repeat protein [Frankia sp. EAN1pec]
MADNGGARRVGRRWLWICAGIAAAGAVAAVVGIWHLPDRMYQGEEARAALQGGLLTAAAALTAVAGGLIALDETRQANAETRRANRDTHVRELYVEAAKLLNDPDNLGVRLAGIYALERIAVDSSVDQRTVVEVLSAFVRTRSTDSALRPPSPADSQESPLVRPAADIRAAVQVLGRLPALDGVPRCDLDGADLTGPAGLGGLDLSEANLLGAQLAGAELTYAVLHGANLTGARLDGADLTSAVLIGAHLAGVKMDGANLSDVRLVGADLTFAQLGGANLTNAFLAMATMTYAVLEGAHLGGALLAGTNLTGARLVGADLTGAQLVNADLTAAQMEGTDLTGARGLAAEQVAAASGDARTRLPDGVERPASWPPYEPPPEQ